MTKTEVSVVSDIEKKVSIWVDPDEVDEKFNNFFESIRKDAQVSGFRKGKAPLNILKRTFKERAKGSIAQMLISEHYQNAVQEHNINPVGQPEVDGEYMGNKYVGHFNDDNSYSVVLNINTLPKVTPQHYKDIVLPSFDANIDDATSKKIDEYRNQFAERKQILDAPAQEGDMLTVDFKGYIDGEPFDGGEAQDFIIDSLGGGSLIPGFEEQLVGVGASDEINVQVKFPENYNAPHLAGKDAEFEVKVNSIVRKTPAAVDEDLALMTGHMDVDELMSETRKLAEEELVIKKRNTLNNPITDHLVKHNDFQIPNVMIGDEINRLAKQYNITKDKVNEQMLAQLKDAAVKVIKRALLLDAIYEEEGLELTPEQLDAELEKQAESVNMTKDEVISQLNNSGYMDGFTAELRARNTLEYLIEVNKDNKETESEEVDE